MATKTRNFLGLLQFLKQATSYTSSRSRHNPVTYVLGNPSADLDSIISAILYSYFATSRSSLIVQRGEDGCSTHQCYVPLINLHDVSSGRELGRLRPEFLTALELATDEMKENRVRHDDDYGCALLKDSILTVADVKERLRLGTRPYTDSAHEMDVFMVDWNALPVLANGSRGIEGITSGDSDGKDDIRICVTGCIDHHEDEGFVPSDVSLRCIQTGVGSCTSLVVRELRSRGWWADNCGPAFDNESRDDGISQHDEDSTLICESHAAKLALAAILADTTNMTAKDKVSETDRLAVSFLEDKIKQTHGRLWNRDEFYGQIIESKNSSVEKLTMEEILGRDYKDWIDEFSTRDRSSNGPETIKIGICSVVKPLSWLFSKASQEDQKSNPPHPSNRPFFNDLSNFGRSRNLDIVAVMTAYTQQPENQFQREFLVWALNKAYLQRLREFERIAAEQLCLQNWSSSDNQDLEAILTPDSPDNGSMRIWRQLDVSKSRKQVAPLLRNVATGKL